MPTDNGRIELAILQPEALPAQVHKVATDVVQGGYAGVVVSPVYVSRVASMVRGSGATVAATVGFPHGTNKPMLKAIEATSCIKDGADAILLVPHLPHLIRGDFDAARAELLEIVRAARATRRDVQINVLIERIADEQPIATACRAIRESGCDGVATSTTGGAFASVRKHAESLIVIAMLTDASAVPPADSDRVIVFV
jgi:deoxyribose-phosphate aldolase